MPYEKYQDCIDACHACATACEHCGHRVPARRAGENHGAPHRTGPHLRGSLVVRRASHVERLGVRAESLRLCAKICRACAEECDKHKARALPRVRGSVPQMRGRLRSYGRLARPSAKGVRSSSSFPAAGGRFNCRGRAWTSARAHRRRARLESHPTSIAAIR